jgi:very-short-patch-repair endonuclease
MISRSGRRLLLFEQEASANSDHGTVRPSHPSMCGMSTEPLQTPHLDLTGPFRGSSALGLGLLTLGVLRSRKFQRLFPDVYAPAELDPDLALRARAAGVLVAGRGAVAGHAAAELLGASCGAPDALVDVLMPGRYRCDGLVVHRDRFDVGETVPLPGGGAVTGPARTAYDLARWANPLIERVVAVDTLAHCCGVGADDVRRLRREYLGAHGGPLIGEVLSLVDPRSESPMESRVRVVLVLGGLPPEVQYPVVVNGRRYRLDLAYPAHRIAVEYDGDGHRQQARARRDLAREADLVAAGWRILRFDARVVMAHPDRIVAAVLAELAARSAC